MPRKYIPSEEELKEILGYYSASKSYQEVSRRTGLGVSIVKRIVTENADKKIEFNSKNYQYIGFPPEEPTTKQIKNFNAELEEFYKEVVKDGGIL